MTEAEWLGCAEPGTPLTFLHASASVRKLRLFACACCRRVEHLLSMPHFIRAVDVSERFADGLASDEERHAAYKVVDVHILAQTLEYGRFRWADFAVVEATQNWSGHIAHPNELARRVADSVRDAAERNPAQREFTLPPQPNFSTFPIPKEEWADYARRSDEYAATEDAIDARLSAREAAAQAALVRDIVGNPFRPAAFSPEWRTDTALALAKQMYDSRDFGAMPILADALQDAGGDSEAILNHCRDASAMHVRGCWVVDLVLGKG